MTSKEYCEEHKEICRGIEDCAPGTHDHVQEASLFISLNTRAITHILSDFDKFKIDLANIEQLKKDIKKLKK